MPSAPKPEPALAEKQVLTTGLRTGIGERGQQRTACWNYRAALNLNSRATWCCRLLEQIGVGAQKIETCQKLHRVAASQSCFSSDKVGFSCGHDCDIRITRRPDKLYEKVAGTGQVVETRGACLVRIESFAALWIWRRRSSLTADRLRSGC